MFGASNHLVDQRRYFRMNGRVADSGFRLVIEMETPDATNGDDLIDRQGHDAFPSGAGIHADQDQTSEITVLAGIHKAA